MIWYPIRLNQARANGRLAALAIGFFAAALYAPSLSAQTPTDTLMVRRAAIDFLKPRNPPAGQRMVLDPVEPPVTATNNTNQRPLVTSQGLAERIGITVAVDSERVNCANGCKMLPENTVVLTIAQPRIVKDSAWVDVSRTTTKMGPPCPAASCGVVVDSKRFQLVVLRVENLWRTVKVNVQP